MLITAKVEEIVAPSAINFLYCIDSSYTEAEILQAEKYILKTLEYRACRKLHARRLSQLGRKPLLSA
jgi:hypothetical protein